MTVSKLADGVHSITATATDVAGNVSAASTARSVTIDTVTPAAPSTPVLAPASDGGVKGDNITNVNTPTFAGTAEAGSTVTILSDGTAVGTGIATSGGSYSVTTSTLTDGTHSITATATDVAGNVSPASAALSVTIDTDVPVISGVSAAPNPFSVSRDGSTTISYTLSEDAAVTVVIANSSGNVINTLLNAASQQAGPHTVAWDGTNSSSAVVVDGTYTYKIDAVDIAGNAATEQTGTVQKMA